MSRRPHLSQGMPSIIGGCPCPGECLKIDGLQMTVHAALSVNFCHFLATYIHETRGKAPP
jgi:hypothetical protein